MLNWRVSQDVLLPLVPRGSELDLYDGESWCSVVAFRFLDTKLLGVPVPFHKNFTEINLRFYVTRRIGDECRRGVVFVREYVPRFWIACVANMLYNEKYQATRMWHSLLEHDDSLEGRFAWQTGKQQHSLSFQTIRKWKELEVGTREQFIAEHYWGYSAQRDGSTIEYQVLHPPWRYAELSNLTLDWDPERCYGPGLAAALCKQPDFAFLADGSNIKVFRGVKVA